MSFFECYADDGTLQFNAETMVYALVGSGNFGTGNQYFGGFGSLTFFGTYGSIDPGIPYDIALFNSSNVVLGSPTPPAGTTSTTVQAYTKDPGTVNYWLFRKYQGITPTSEAGMRLYDASANLLYDALYKPLIINQKYPVTSMSNGMSVSISTTVGRTYAAVPYGSSIRNGVAYAPPPDAFGNNPNGNACSPNAGLRFASGTLYLEEVYAWSTGSNTYGNSGFLIADVTGF